MKRITIGIITYNQENKIGRALDSILQQKEKGLHQIIVSDDCSKDGTWEVLQKYKAKFPEIIFPHRNIINLGIYGNIKELESLLPDSDLYGYLSGDDEYCDGYFESVQRLIEYNHINTDTAIGIFSDWKSVYPNNSESIFNQAAVLSGCRLWSLKARGIISSRSLLISKTVRDRFEAILENRGLNLMESHYDAQPHLIIKNAYYIPQVTTIYYSGIGVSSCMSIKESDYFTVQNIEKWEYGIQHYVQDEVDLHYGIYEILKSKFYMHPSVHLYLKMLYHYHKGQLPLYHIPLKQSIRTFLGFIKYSLFH